MSVVVAVVPDLMDRSKIDSSMEGVQFVSSVKAIPEDFAGYLVADISRPGVIEALAELDLSRIKVVAFAGHLERERLQAARDLGCIVKTRGQFFSGLPALC